MSADKHRNAEDRQLVLEHLAAGDVSRARDILARRRCTVDLRYRDRRRYSYYSPRHDSLGRDPYRMVRELLDDLHKRGLIRYVRYGGGRPQGKLKRKVAHIGRPGFAVVENPPSPGKARNERRGQSKPGGRRA